VDGGGVGSVMEYMLKKRNLILSLVAAEVVRRPFLLFNFKLILAFFFISPALAFRMACQLRTAAPVVKEEIQRLVQLNPKVVAHIPGAIDYLITRECITKDLPELKALSWFVSLSFLLV